MRALALGLTLLASLLSSGPAGAAERSVTLAVENMTCASCDTIVRRSLARVPGVRSVAVAPAAGTATVVFDDAVTTATALAETATKAGFPARSRAE